MKNIIIFGSYKGKAGENTRNLVLCQAIAETGSPIAYCVADFGFAPSSAKPAFKILYALVNAPVRWGWLILKYLFMPRHDIIYVPFPSYLDGWLACIIAGLSGKKVVVDAFLGLYDTIVRDRGLFGSKSFIAQLIWHYEKRMLRMANRILVDTESHARMFQQDFNLPLRRIVNLPVGIDETLWRPSRKSPDAVFRVTFWSTFIPLHGVDIVAGAAAILEEKYPEICFRIIGNGQLGQDFRRILSTSTFRNVEWIDRFIPLKDIQRYVEASDCCLGIFGKSDKTRRVIPYKAYQALASARPLITAKTRETEKLLEDGISALLVSPGDPYALADAIVRLFNDRELACCIGKNGRKIYDAQLSYHVIRDKIRQMLINLADQTGRL